MKLRPPRSTLNPPVSNARFSAVGLVSSRFVGARVSVTRPAANAALGAVGVVEVAGLHQLEQQLGGGEVPLEQRAEQRVLGPRGVAEAGVLALGRNRLLQAGAERADGDVDAALDEPGAEAGERGHRGLGPEHGTGQGVTERAHDRDRVGGVEGTFGHAECVLHARRDVVEQRPTFAMRDPLCSVRRARRNVR